MRIVEGAFVKALFPMDEKPREPRLLHICYCIGATEKLAIVAYTTSKRWTASDTVPFGIRVFDADDARSLRQRPFVLDLRRLVKLPLSRRWFPYLHAPDQGVIVRAPGRLRTELQETVKELLQRRRHLVSISGDR